jgi:hypothetical protein
MVAVFGTQAADVLHIKFHVPYTASTAFYAVVLTVIFIVWYRVEGTLSIHSIRTPRRELFYWATVLATFALGTATGDLTARTLNLGYLASGIWFSIVFAAVAVAHWKFGLNSILAFWICYVLTRPVGASFADYVAFPHSFGGLGVGHGPVALFLTFLIVIFVGYMAVTRKDVEEAPPSARSGHRRGVPSSAEYPPPYQRGPYEEESYPPRHGRSPYERGPYEEQSYPPRSGRSDGESYPPRRGRSPYEEQSYPPRSGRSEEESYPPRRGRSPYQRGPYEEESYPPPSGRSDGESYPPRRGRSPYERGPYGEPFDEEPYPPQPRDEEPRRPPEGFFAWDDR